MFGGSAGGSNLNDYWVLTNANGSGGVPEWIELVPATSKLPAARSGHVAVYDTLEDAMTIFGGIGQPPETWTASHASGVAGSPVWTETNLGAAGISSLAGCSAVFDTGSLTLVVFGGDNTKIVNSVFALFPVL